MLVVVKLKRMDAAVPLCTVTQIGDIESVAASACEDGNRQPYTQTRPRAKYYPILKYSDFELL